MNYANHLVIAFVFLLLTAFIIKWTISDIILFLPLSMASALLPDIDHPRSKITFLLKTFILLPFSYYFSYSFFDSWSRRLIGGTVLLAVSLALLRFFRPRHRGITHTLSALIIFTVLVYILFLNKGLTIACSMGYFSHLIADRCLRII